MTKEKEVGKGLEECDLVAMAQVVLLNMSMAVRIYIRRR